MTYRIVTAGEVVFNRVNGQYVKNTDPEWAAFLTWAGSNTPEPPAPEWDQDGWEKQVARAEPVIQYLRTHTPDECEAYVQANVTDLATARQMLRKFAVALCVLARGI